MSALSAWNVSAWSLLRQRGPGPTALAPGQLAGSQAGVRVIAPPLATIGGVAISPALRLSSALAPSRQGEGAVSAVFAHRGTSHRVQAFVERRFSIAKGGRNAFGAGLAGGGQLTLSQPNLTLRGYGQAGFVGLRSRDLYVDGALSAERRVIESSAVEVAIGAGSWGGAQPRLSRLDAGPFAAITTRGLGPPIRTTIGWRARIAGNAAPGSGPVLTVGADF